MKIIHITAAYKPAYIYGGPTMSVAKLCECLENCGDVELGSWEVKGSVNGEEKLDIEVFTTTANGKQELEVETQQRVIVDGVNVTYFKRLTKDHTHLSPGLLWRLRSEIVLNKKNSPLTSSKGAQDSSLKKTFNDQRKTKNDLIIHIHAWWNLVSVLSCLIGKWYQIPVVLSPRGMLTSYTQSNRNSLSKKLIHGLIGKKLLQYCHVHATSEQERDDILSIVKPKSIKIIPNLVELEGVSGVEEQRVKWKVESSEFKVESLEVEKQRQENSPSDKFKLIFLSRIEEKKGLDLLFDALALLDFDFTLSIAGSGEQAYIDSLKAKAIRLNIHHRIIWLGQLYLKEKFKALQQHDMMVLTSYNENFANVVIESLSVGTAVMLSDQVGLSTYVLSNNLGWISPLDTNVIAKTLKIAAQDADKRNKISKLGPSIILRDFSDKTLAQKYIKLYTDIANGRI